MKNSKNILLNCISIILLCNASCRPEGGPKEEQHYGPYYFGEYANYFYFKPGTYWIYENNRTGEFDTCILTDIYRDTITLFGETADFKRWYTEEVINYNVYTNHRGILTYTTNLPCLVCIGLNPLISLRRGSTSNVFYIPWNTYPESSAYFSSYKIGSNMYSEVYRFDVEKDGSLPFWDNTILLWGELNGTSEHSSYFWAKDIGLIRIMYTTIEDTGPDTAYWNLKEYNVQKF